MKAYLTRLNYSDKQTLGQLMIFEDTEMIFICRTLELGWKNNMNNVSCIPKGTYLINRRFTDKRGAHFKITELDEKEVKGRTDILIHSANFYKDILGCIAVGQQHTDINKDGLRDVTSSVDTMIKLNKIISETIEFEICGKF